MGAALHSVREAVTAGNDADKVAKLEQLSMLEKMAKDHLRATEYDILNGKRGDQQIHSGTVVQRGTYLGIQVKESSHAATTVGTIIKDFFSGDILKGIKDIIQSGADVILGNKSIGENEFQQMLVLWENNALLRIDVYYWRYNFSSNDVMKCGEAVYAAMLLKRVVKLGSIDTAVLAFCITNAAKRLDKSDDDIAKDVEKARKLQEQIKQLKITGYGEVDPGYLPIAVGKVTHGGPKEEEEQKDEVMTP